PPHVRQPEDADVAERQPAREEPQLNVPIRAAPSSEPLLGVPADRRPTAHVDQLLERDGAAHRGAARPKRERGRWRVARRKVGRRDRKSTRLNSSHVKISYAVFCLKK